MKVFLLRDDERIPCKVPYKDADHAVAEGKCPHCGAETFKVQGTGKRPSQDDRAYEADARCAACDLYVGVLRAEVSTLFGVREDEAVMRRCRVY